VPSTEKWRKSAICGRFHWFGDLAVDRESRENLDFSNPPLEARKSPPIGRPAGHFKL
jgi:hypothetical protein